MRGYDLQVNMDARYDFTMAARKGDIVKMREIAKKGLKPCIGEHCPSASPKP